MVARHDPVFRQAILYLGGLILLHSLQTNMAVICTSWLYSDHIYNYIHIYIYIHKIPLKEKDITNRSLNKYLGDQKHGPPATTEVSNLAQSNMFQIFNFSGCLYDVKIFEVCKWQFHPGNMFFPTKKDRISCEMPLPSFFSCPKHWGLHPLVN